MPGPVGEPDRGERLRRPRLARRVADPERHQRRLDVLLRRQRRDQVERLEDEPDRAGPHLGHRALAEPGQLAPVQLKRAGGRPVEAAEQLEQRGLPVPGRPLDGQPLAVGDLQVDAAQRVHDVAALGVVLDDFRELVHGLCSPFPGPGQATLASAAAGRSARRPPAAEPAGDQAAEDGEGHRGDDRGDRDRRGQVHRDRGRGVRRVGEAAAERAAGRAGARGAPAPPYRRSRRTGARRPAWRCPSRCRARRTAAGRTCRRARRPRSRARRRPRRRRSRWRSTRPSPGRLPGGTSSRVPSACRTRGRRRVTADIVSRVASRNAATSTAIASHLPRLLASDAALEIEPVTSLASVLWSVTVAPGTALLDRAGHRGDLVAAGRRHVDRVDVVLQVGQGLGHAEREVDVRRVVARRLGDDADDR